MTMRWFSVPKHCAIVGDERTPVKGEAGGKVYLVEIGYGVVWCRREGRVDVEELDVSMSVHLQA